MAAPGVVESQRIVGLGRLCIDLHLEVEESFIRFDSHKCSVRETRALGGSVLGILRQLASAGHRCHLVSAGGAGEQRAWVEEQLRGLGLSGEIFPIPLPCSYVTYHETGRLDRILTATEQACELLQRAAVLDSLSRLEWDWLVVDARHLEAATGASERTKQRGGGVFLDPGSSVGLRNLERDDRLLLGATVACLDASQLQRLLGAGDNESAAAILLRRGVEVVVTTGAAGGAQLFTREVKASAQQLRSHSVGSSLGVGDTFRGWLLAGLLATGFRPGSRLTRDQAQEVLRLALAAAMLRKEDTALLPRGFSWEEVARYLEWTAQVPERREAAESGKLRPEPPQEETLASQARIWVVFGIPGAGKSSLAAALGAALQRPVLDSDAIGCELWRSPSMREAGAAACSDLAMSILFSQLRHLVSLGGSVIVDAAMTRARRWQVLEAIARAESAEVLPLYLDCAEEVALRRIVERRQREPDRHFVSHDQRSLRLAGKRLKALVLAMRERGAAVVVLDRSLPFEEKITRALQAARSRSGRNGGEARESYSMAGKGETPCR